MGDRIDKAAVRRAFGRAAADYERHAVLQDRVAAQLAERLDIMKLAPRVLVDGGCGSGLLTRRLAQRFPAAEVMAFDLAPAMVAAARGKGLGAWWRNRRWRFFSADLEALPLRSASVDMVASSLALQWVDDPVAVFREVARVLRPGGLWLFATFGPDTLRELRQSFASLDGRPHVSRFVDMHDLGDALLGAGFETPVMEMEFVTMTYPDLRGLMMDLKGIGAHNALADRSRGMMGKEAWRALNSAYAAYAMPDRRLPATYEIIYGHAWARGPAVVRMPKR